MPSFVDLTFPSLASSHRWLLAVLIAITAIVASPAATPPTLAPAPAGAWVEVNGAKLWYWTEGQGEPLILVEGGPGAYGYLDPFFKELAATHLVIHFRGLGRDKSDRPANRGDYSFQRDLSDLEGFRRALGLGPVNLFGHSYGGMLVTAYALQYPESVKRLVICNGLYSAEMWQAGTEHINVSIRDLAPEIWAELMRLRAQGLRSSAPEHAAQIAKVPEAMMYLASQNNSGKTPVQFNSDVYFAIAGDDVDFQVGGSIAGLDLGPRLKELKMPVLITASRYDRAVLPRYALEYPRLAPQAQFVMFEASGHAVYLEENAQLISTLQTFLATPVQ